MAEVITGVRSPLMQALGLLFVWIFCDDEYNYSVTSKRDAELVIQMLLEEKRITVEEATSLREEIDHSGLAPDTNALIEKARAYSMTPDHKSYEYLHICTNPDCPINRSTKLPHAFLDFGGTMRGIMCTQDAVDAVFAWTRRAENPFSPEDAIEIMVKLADAGLPPDQLELKDRLAALGEEKEQDAWRYINAMRELMHAYRGRQRGSSLMAVLNLGDLFGGSVFEI